MRQIVYLEEFTFPEHGISPYGISDDQCIRRFFRYNAESDVDQMRYLASGSVGMISIPDGEDVSVSICTWQNEYISVFE